MLIAVAEETDWDRIVLLYDALLQISPSLIVALNRAVAVGMAHGPAAGIEALDAAAMLNGDADPTRHVHDEEPAGTRTAGG